MIEELNKKKSKKGEMKEKVLEVQATLVECCACERCENVTRVIVTNTQECTIKVTVEEGKQTVSATVFN